MRSYKSLNSRTLNVLVKNSNTLANVFQTNYLGNTVSVPSGGGGGESVDLSSYALKTYVDSSLNNYVLLNGVYTKSYVDASFAGVYTKSYVDGSLNTINTKLYTLTNGAPEALDTLAEITTAIKSDASFGIVVYQKIASSDSSINDLRTMISSGTQDPSINSVILQNTVQDTSINLLTTSINNVYTKSYIDNSFGNVYTKSYVDASFGNVYTKSYIDNSFGNVYSRSYIDNSFGNVYTRSYIDNSFGSVISNNTSQDLSFNGNLQLGSGNRRIGINKTAAVGSSLDVSGAATITGNLSLTKNPSDASYSYFDLSSVNINLFNTVEKFTRITFATSMTLDYRLGSIFYTDPSASVSFSGLSITNVPTTLNRSITVTLITPQSGTFYFTGTAITVNGTSITYIKQDGTAFAAPSASRTMIIYQFTLIFASATPTVVGFMTGYS
jgi:hypothetical protein